MNGLLREIVIDKSAANTEGIKDIKRMLNWFKCAILFELVRNKYLNNLVEQDHRFIKRRALMSASASRASSQQRQPLPGSS